MHVDELSFSNFAMDLRVPGDMSKDLVWSTYRHRPGMCTASVMWLPRTQHPLTMHNQRATSQWKCRAAPAYNFNQGTYRKATPKSPRH
jgi:hypothetical protein